VKQVEELIVAGRVDDARAVASATPAGMPPTVKLGLGAGTTRPLAVRRFMQRAAASILLRANAALRR
jgi:hypothetical protein